jgi:alkylation response protein AidB-like acyl-CoA dehydrogenase
VVDFGLSPEQQKWVSKAERLAPVFAAQARKFDEAGQYPAENFDLLREEGFLKLAVPKEFGGLGDAAGYCAWLPHLAVEKVAAGCGNTGWDLLTHYHGCGLLAGLGDDEQRSRMFADIVERGALMGSLGSEVNPAQVKTTSVPGALIKYEAGMEPVEGGFLANARKGFCSMGPIADYLVYWALAPGTQNNADGMALSIVPGTSPGLTFLNDWDEVIGIRASHSGGAKLENVFIPWENVLGEPGDYVQKYPYTFELTYVVQLLGIAQGAYDFTRNMLVDRAFLQSDDTVMYTMGEMSSALAATRTAWYYAQWLWDQRQWDEAHHATLRALHQAKTTSLMVATKCFDVIGVRALFKFNPLQQSWRDIRTVTLHTRESQFMRLLAAGDISGQRFTKEKYGERLSTRKTWSELGIPRTPFGKLPNRLAKATAAI